MPRWPPLFLVFFFSPSLWHKTGQRKKQRRFILYETTCFFIFKALFSFLLLHPPSVFLVPSISRTRYIFLYWLATFSFEKEKKRKRKGQSTRPFWDRTGLETWRSTPNLHVNVPLRLCLLCVPFSHRNCSCCCCCGSSFGCYQSIEIPDA